METKRSESIVLTDPQWAYLDHIARTTRSTVGPRERPSWRVLVRRIAAGELSVAGITLESRPASTIEHLPATKRQPERIELPATGTDGPIENTVELDPQ